MNRVTKTSLLLIGTIGLAGCDGASEAFEFDPTFNSFAEINAALAPDVSAAAEKDGTLTSFANSNISDSDDFDTLTTGSVTYNGAIIAEQTSDAGTLIGQLQITADLDTNALDGIAGNFFHSEDGEVGGRMFGSSTFTQDVGSDGDHFEMQLSGNLEQGGTAFDATVDLTGNFFNDGDSVGQVAGDADFEFAGGGPEYEQGAFQGSR
ncbi:hypothetical protein [Roseobacter sp. CCS2]|uniref:hypothetical protein n=1 Tax=Roseobacter sp. CCS2 TaxID=391593 RepID=UPI0000F3E3D2|nr:hypothetical protein [Roseobacter sp. CCS2]EBA11012.1 hypothetical protein RCCS2_00984 [Roseobacter sp. CCS2]